MTHRFLERRWYRSQALLDGVGAKLRPVDLPSVAMAGCLYRAVVQVSNDARAGCWNDPEKSSPRFAMAARVTGAHGFELLGPHTVLPAAFRAGESREVHFILETPRHPGEYAVEIDLVREGATGFAISEIPCSVFRSA